MLKVPGNAIQFGYPRGRQVMTSMIFLDRYSRSLPLNPRVVFVIETLRHPTLTLWQGRAII